MVFPSLNRYKLLYCQPSTFLMRQPLSTPVIGSTSIYRIFSQKRCLWRCCEVLFLSGLAWLVVIHDQKLCFVIWHDWARPDQTRSRQRLEHAITYLIVALVFSKVRHRSLNFRPSIRPFVMFVFFIRPSVNNSRRPLVTMLLAFWVPSWHCQFECRSQKGKVVISFLVDPSIKTVSLQLWKLQVSHLA